nr:MAG TPA: hypothetical protein [Caudoviricetes sp.]DAW74558.1 MAG TPA: hypothetical protein [Caudoviricetes sp.]
MLCQWSVINFFGVGNQRSHELWHSRHSHYSPTLF